MGTTWDELVDLSRRTAPHPVAVTVMPRDKRTTGGATVHERRPSPRRQGTRGAAVRAAVREG